MRQQTAIKPQGAWQVRRGLRVPAMKHQADALSVEQALSRLPGVLGVEADAGRSRVRIVYEITLTDFGRICSALTDSGFPPHDGWWQRLLAGWYQYLDSNGRENAHAPAPPCCSNPKGIIDQAGKRPKH